MIKFQGTKFENYERFYTLIVLMTMQQFICFNQNRKIKFVTAKELTREVNKLLRGRIKGSEIPLITKEQVKQILNEASGAGLMCSISFGEKLGIDYTAYCPNWYTAFNPDVSKYKRSVESIKKKKQW